MNQAQTESWLSRAKARALLGRDFLRLLGKQYREDGCREIAAALTFTTLFAIVPIMTVAFAILGALPALRERGEEIRGWLFDYFVPSAGSRVQEHLSGFAEQAANLTVIGVIFLVVTSVLLLRTIEVTMNRIWKITTPRSMITSLLMYWAVLTLGPLLLGAGLGISSYVTSVSLVSETFGLLGGRAFWLAVLPFFFTTAMLSLLYIIVPNSQVPIRQGVAGAAVAALFFELAKGGFALFVSMAPTYQVVYGAFAAVPVFLLWIFISWSIVLLGAELVRALVVFREQRREGPPLQSLLRLLELLWERQHQGEPLRADEVGSVLARIRAGRWETFRNLLLELGLMRRSDNGHFFLARDLRELTLAQLVALLPWPAHTQLEVGEGNGRSWERGLAERCHQALEGMNEPLDISLEALFTSETRNDRKETQ